MSQMWVANMPKGVYPRKESFSRNQPRPYRVVETPEQLADKLGYDPETGRLFWLRTGKNAGSKNQGYLRVGKLGIYNHRLIWFKMTGQWPVEVDHINRDRSDNRWVNLRECSHEDNTKNVPARPSQSGVKNVHKHNNGYMVRLGKSFRKFVVDFEEACCLAQQKRVELYGAFGSDT